MSVLCEALSVIVPKARLEACWPGGVRNYATRVINSTYCEDKYLTRVGFMSPTDVSHWLDLVENRSQLRTHAGHVWLDVAVVDQFKGPTGECVWLEFARENDLSRAWMHGRAQGDLATPRGWEPQDLTFIPNEEVEGLLLTPTNTPGVESFIDPATGVVRFVAHGGVEAHLIHEAWAQHLVDEVESQAGAVEQVVSTMSPQHVVTPRGVIVDGARPEDGVKDAICQIRALGDGSVGPELSSAIGVAFLTYGPLQWTFPLEGGGELPIDGVAHYLVFSGYRDRAASRALEFLESIAARFQDPAELDARLAVSDPLDAVFGRALRAAVESGPPDKRVALGRVVAAALEDEAVVDRSGLLVDTLAQVEAPPIKALVSVRETVQEVKDLGEWPTRATGAEHEILSRVTRVGNAFDDSVIRTLKNLGLIFAGESTEQWFVHDLTPYGYELLGFIVTPLDEADET